MNLPPSHFCRPFWGPLALRRRSRLASPAQFLGDLPAHAAITGTAIDSAGNILIAGYIGTTVGNRLHQRHLRGPLLARTGRTSSPTCCSTIVASPDSPTDDAGNAYVTGTTTSAAFPTTPGAWQRTPGAQGSAFILKLDGAGTIVYSTLFGGPAGNPYPAAIAVNHAGEALVTGGNGGALPVSEGALALERDGRLHRPPLGSRRPDDLFGRRSRRLRDRGGREQQCLRRGRFIRCQHRSDFRQRHPEDRPVHGLRRQPRVCVSLLAPERSRDQCGRHEDPVLHLPERRRRRRPSPRLRSMPTAISTSPVPPTRPTTR